MEEAYCPMKLVILLYTSKLRTNITNFAGVKQYIGPWAAGHLTGLKQLPLL